MPSALFSCVLLAAEAESQPRSEIRFQTRITNHVVVFLVERISDIHVSSHVLIHCVPATNIEARVACRVIDTREAVGSEEEIGVGAAADQCSAEA